MAANGVVFVATGVMSAAGCSKLDFATLMESPTLAHAIWLLTFVGLAGKLWVKRVRLWGFSAVV